MFHVNQTEFSLTAWISLPEWLSETVLQGLLLISGLLATKPRIYFIKGAPKSGRHDWRKVRQEKRVGKMKEKGLEQEENRGGITRRQTADARRGGWGGWVTVQEKSDFLLVL